jgi:hypothetical protein
LNFQVWFDKDIFKGIDDDERLEDADVEAAITAIKKKGGKILQKETKSSAESGYTSDESESGDKRVKVAKIGKKSKVAGEDSDSSSDSDSDYDMRQLQSLKPTNG